MEQEQKLQVAQQRAEAKIGFYTHAGVFIAVNLLLVTINLMTDAGTLWFVWPLMGWGVFLLAHGLFVYNASRSSDFRKKMVEKELSKLEGTQNSERTWKEDPHDKPL